MYKDKAVTYGLLAHIRQQASLVKGPLEIFIPLIKRALSKMNEDGIFDGKNINEIKAYTNDMYSLDFPYPVLRKILREIANSVNTAENKKIILNNDDSFQIIGYHFTEIEEIINTHKREVGQLERMFQEFCDDKEGAVKASSIFEFIDSNRRGLSKYLANRKKEKPIDFTLEAQFVEFFKRIPQLYEQIKNIYLGSIISSYIEYEVEPINTDIELLFDTNFLVALLDLNTPESHHTAKILMKIGKQQGFKFTVLIDTLNEMKWLIEAKAKYFNDSFLIKKTYPEDIYNACERKNINKADLERIADNLEKQISNKGISIIYHTEKYKNIARHSSVYTTLQKYRNTKTSALHDATAIHYVRLKRGKKMVSKFEKINCWFVNNAISRDNEFYRKLEDRNKQSEQIKADDLLNILWLSNPAINKNLESDIVADIGLSSLIAVTLADNLPKVSIIRELDDNIHKYCQDEISDEDIVRLSRRIANKELKDLNNINELAKMPSKEAFVKRLETEIEKQKRKEEERAKQFNNVLEEFQKYSKSLKQQEKSIQQKSKAFDEKINQLSSKDLNNQSKISELENQLREKERLIYEGKCTDYIAEKIKIWRMKSFIPFVIGLASLILGVIYFLAQANWDSKLARTNFINWQDNLIILFIMFIGGTLFAYSFKMIYDCLFSHSQIENFKKSIELPDKF